jgi:positive phototaxis protein PixI
VESTSLTHSSTQNHSERLNSYLEVQLDDHNLALIPMQYIQEVIVVSRGKITPIPNMANCVLGLIDRRSRIYWVLDLAHFLEISYLPTQRREYYLVFVRVSDRVLGLAVQSVQGITKFTLEHIKSPLTSVSPSLMPYLQGCIFKQQDSLLVLEVFSIVNSPKLQEI